MPATTQQHRQHRQHLQRANKNMSSFKLVTAILAAASAVQGVDGFRSGTGTRPFVLTYFGPDDDEDHNSLFSRQPNIARQRQAAKDWAAVFKARNRLKKPAYDLGLGKNPPVGHTVASAETRRSIATAMTTAFLIEHESVRDYPSPVPLRIQAEQHVPIGNENKATSERAQRERPTLPKVQHRRKAQDVLSIATSAAEDGLGTVAASAAPSHLTADLPIIKPVYQGAAFNVNTVWVEMMIHSEQNNLELSN